jgi:hypothetical protein
MKFKKRSACLEAQDLLHPQQHLSLLIMEEAVAAVYITGLNLPSK